jgi:hypothetical protein
LFHPAAGATPPQFAIDVLVKLAALVRVRISSDKLRSGSHLISNELESPISEELKNR